MQELNEEFFIDDKNVELLNIYLYVITMVY